MPTVQLHQNKYEDMISRRGVSVKWEMAQRCTCWTENSGQPLYSCKACNGIGYIYSDPIFDEHGMLVMNLALNKEFTQLGEYRMGDCIATVPQRKKIKNEQDLWEYVKNEMYDIAEWDKVTLMNSEFRSHEVLIKGEPMYGREPDTLRNEEITRILKATTIDEYTGEKVDYSLGVDFEINKDKITWLDTGKNPADGEKYSILYYHRPVYIVYTQLPQSRDQDSQHFPRKVVLRYRDVV